MCAKHSAKPLSRASSSNFFDDLPPDVFILVLLADDDGQLACRPQADVTTKHTPILDIKQFPVCVQIMIHPLQQRQNYKRSPCYLPVCRAVHPDTTQVLYRRPDNTEQAGCSPPQKSDCAPCSLFRLFIGLIPFCVVYLSINHSFKSASGDNYAALCNDSSCIYHYKSNIR